jgi:hypothetical protein
MRSGRHAHDGEPLRENTPAETPAPVVEPAAALPTANLIGHLARSSTDARSAAMSDLHARVGNREVARMILAHQVPALNDLPAKLPGLGAPEGAQPDWVTAVSKDPLPGDLVPGYVEWRMSFDEKDRESMARSLDARVKSNTKNFGEFFGAYAGGLTELWGKAATEEMGKAAANAGFNAAQGMLKFLVVESLAGIAAAATGGAALALRSRVLLTHMSGLLTDYAAGLKADSLDKAYGGRELSERKAVLDGIATQLGQHIEGLLPTMLEQLNKDAHWYAWWLRAAPLEDLRRFRIPPPFPPISRGLVRGIVASLVVGHLNANAPHIKPWYGGQGAPGNYKGRGTPKANHENIVMVELAATGPRAAKPYGAYIVAPSEMLRKEIAGNVPIGSMPNVPLYITVGSGMGRTGPEPEAARLMDALRGGIATKRDVERFAKAYPESSTTRATITRDAKGNVLAHGGGIALQMWLFDWTGGDMSDLVQQVLAGTSNEPAKREYEEDAQVSSMVEPERLAPSTHEYLRLSMRDGGSRLIEEFVNGLVPGQPPREKGYPYDTYDLDDRWRQIYGRRD